MVVSTSGGLKLSRKLALGAATARQLEDAFRAGLPVEGKVERAVKGGDEVRVARQRAFCPMSQIEMARKTDPANTKGVSSEFRIIEDKERGRTSSPRDGRFSKRSSGRLPTIQGDPSSWARS